MLLLPQQIKITCSLGDFTISDETLWMCSTHQRYCCRAAPLGVFVVVTTFYNWLSSPPVARLRQPLLLLKRRQSSRSCIPKAHLPIWHHCAASSPTLAATVSDHLCRPVLERSGAEPPSAQKPRRRPVPQAGVEQMGTHQCSGHTREPRNAAAEPAEWF